MDSIRRVVFYSKNDLSSGHNLKNAETILEKFDPNHNFDINDILELYHIKIYFDNEIYLNSWTEQVKQKYSIVVNSFWNVIRDFWIDITNENILNHFNNVDYKYYESFWYLFNQLNVYDRVKTSKIKEITKSSRFSIRQVLKQSKTVNFYSPAIKEFLFSNTDSAEILLSYFEEDKSSDQKKNVLSKKLDSFGQRKNSR